MSRFNKATAAAVVGVAAWLVSLAGLEVPAEVQAMLVTLLVFAVPNRPSRGADE